MIIIGLFIIFILSVDLWNLYHRKIGYYRTFILPSGPKVYYTFNGFYPYPELIGKSFKCNVPNVDYVSFKAINEVYARDRNHIYFFGKVVENVDPHTFTIISARFAKDRNHVYFKQFQVGSAPPLLCTKIDGADPQTFEDIGNGNGKDKNYYYELGKRVKENPQILPKNF